MLPEFVNLMTVAWQHDIPWPCCTLPVDKITKDTNSLERDFWAGTGKCEIEEGFGYQIHAPNMSV
jgi:hypothetical protein